MPVTVPPPRGTVTRDDGTVTKSAELGNGLLGDDIGWRDRQGVQAGGLVEVKELGHLVLYVRDLDRSVHFYRDVLGWRSIAEESDVLGPVRVAAFSAPSNRTHHELLLIEVGPHAAALPAGRRVGLYHFGLKVGDSDDDLRAALQVLSDNDVTIVGASDHTVTHSLYIQDPDENEIELYIDVPGVNWRDDPTLLVSPIKPLRL